jgi:nucleotide-binding universal stress UspA family protein
MYKRILLTLDGSQLARAATRQAQALAGGTDTEVVVFEAVAPLSALRTRFVGEGYPFTGGRPEAIEEMAENQHFILREAAHAEVERAAQELRDAGVKATTDVQDGAAGNAILDAAERYGADAIVMATRGHGGLGREIVGSVAEYVLRHAGDRAVLLAGPRATHARTAG